MKIMIILLLIILSYLYGSIPFALVIGKLFYNTDIRNQGSGNLGGTNAGRVLGKKAGISVILLDATKCCFSILMARLVTLHYGIQQDVIYLCAMACVLGHCYPIFAGFKGGKAVSVAIGYLLVTSLPTFFIAIVNFLTVLKLSKYVSLASILTAILIVVVAPFMGYPLTGILTNILIAGLLIYKHSANIERIKNKTENKITWM